MKYCIYCMEEISTDKCPHCGKVQSEHRCKEHVLPPGTMLSDRYLLGDTLGEGGFGITYIAFDTLKSEKVAVKEYFPVGMVTRSTAHSSSVTIISSDKHEDMVKKGKKDIDREAQILSAFKNEPGIVTIKNRFSLNNTVYLVTEYLGRLTLKTYLERSGRIRSDTVLCMFLPIMNSLKKVHEAGLIHRDIAPDNIMLCGENVVLIDFGAAREYLDEKSMSVILKRGYAPYEQYHSHGKQGAWTDIYSICAVMYHCITGEKVAEPLSRQETETLIPPSQMGIEIDPVFEKALLHGLEIRPGNRPQSIDALLKEMHIDPDEIDSSASPIIVPQEIYEEKEETDSYVTEPRPDISSNPEEEAKQILPPIFDDTDYDPNKHRQSEMINAEEQEETLRRAREAERKRREEEERKRQEQEKAKNENKETITNSTNDINTTTKQKKKFPLFIIPSALVAIIIIAVMIKNSTSSNPSLNTAETTAVNTDVPMTTTFKKPELITYKQLETTTTKPTTTTTTTTTRATTTTTTKPTTTTTTTRATTTTAKTTTTTTTTTPKLTTTTTPKPTTTTTTPKPTTTTGFLGHSEDDFVIEPWEKESENIDEDVEGTSRFDYNDINYGLFGYYFSTGLLYIDDFSIFGMTFEQLKNKVDIEKNGEWISDSIYLWDASEDYYLSFSFDNNGKLRKVFTREYGNEWDFATTHDTSIMKYNSGVIDESVLEEDDSLSIILNDDWLYYCTEYKKDDEVIYQHIGYDEGFTPF